MPYRYSWIFVMMWYLSGAILVADSVALTLSDPFITLLWVESVLVIGKHNDLLYTCPHWLSVQTLAKFWQRLFDSSPAVFMHFLQVAAYNSEGKSNPSQVVEFITNPDRPSCPCRPVIRGRVLPNSFKMAWGEHFLSMPFSLSKRFTVTCSWQATKASL